MYEDLAWKNFLKTGSVESFLEYKKINKLNCAETLDDYNDDIDEENEERSKT